MKKLDETPDRIRAGAGRWLYLLPLLLALLSARGQATPLRVGAQAEESVAPFIYDVFGAGSGSESADFDSFDLEGLTKEARSVVEQGLDLHLPAELSISSVTRAEMRRALASEALTRHLAGLMDPGAELDPDAELPDSATRPVAEILLAKHFPAEGCIRVVERNLRDSMRMAEVPEEQGPGLLRAILVHELVHVVDEQRFGWSEGLLECATGDQVQAFSAMLEGHAQLVARGLCASAGWEADFERYTQLIGFSPPLGEGAGAELLSRALSVAASFAYHAGERYWEHMLAQGGEGIEARVFAHPPASVVLVSHPDWYLHPERRPERAYDLTLGLELFESCSPGPEWMATRVEVSLAQLEAATKILGEAERRRTLDALVATQAVVLQPRAAPASAIYQGVLYESSDALEASFWLSMQERVMRLRDESMKEGAIRITAAAYEEIVRAGATGLYVDKTVHYQGVDVPVQVVLLCQGPLLVEMTASNYPVERELMISTAQRMLAAVSHLGEQGAQGADESEDDK